MQRREASLGAPEVTVTSRIESDSHFSVKRLLPIQKVTVTFSTRNYVLCPSNSREIQIQIVSIVFSCCLWPLSVQAATAELPKAGPVAQAGKAQAVQMEQKSHEKEKDEKVEYDTTTGVVTGLGSRFIAVEYRRDNKHGASFEMAFPVDEQVVFSRVKALRDLKLGDTVEIEYQTVSSNKSEKGEYTDIRRVATRIGLLRNAPSEGLTLRGQ